MNQDRVTATDVVSLFLSFATHNTQSDPDSGENPSALRLLNFARFLGDVCRQVGLSEVEVDGHGYVYATLPPAKGAESIPPIGFIAHYDTSPDFSGEGVAPKIINNYDGNDIPLGALVLSPEEFPSLRQYRGHDLITTDGRTLLGADDKAGVAEILAAVQKLMRDNKAFYGKVRVAFTPDEEIGHGADHFDVGKFGTEFAFTVDGGELGELEYESFNAANATIRIIGKSVHPGTAKGIMINAAQIAAEIACALPRGETPETTEGYEGFYHLYRTQAAVEKARMDILVRDFDRQRFEQRKAFLSDIVAQTNFRCGQEVAQLSISDQYYNMADILKDRSDIIELAVRSMKSVNIIPKIVPIRGGTDGSRLSFMGLPCPNLFTGGQNFHGPYEYISIQAMEKAVDLIAAIIRRHAGEAPPRQSAAPHSQL